MVHRFFDGCSSGDLDVLLSTLAPDVVHYFVGFPPIRSAEHLARYWRKYKTALNPTWSVDRAIARGDEVVSEWSCIWTPPDTERRIAMRGSEWYILRDRRIAEVRAYFVYDDASDAELAGFPYRERGYLVTDP